MCVQWIETNSEIIAGEEKVVDIDEAKIGKKKCNKRQFVEGQWILGGIERSNKQLFIEPVHDCSANTLLYKSVT